MRLRLGDPSLSHGTGPHLATRLASAVPEASDHCEEGPGAARKDESELGSLNFNIRRAAALPGFWGPPVGEGEGHPASEPSLEFRPQASFAPSALPCGASRPGMLRRRSGTRPGVGVGSRCP